MKILSLFTRCHVLSNHYSYSFIQFIQFNYSFLQFMTAQIVYKYIMSLIYTNTPLTFSDVLDKYIFGHIGMHGNHSRLCCIRQPIQHQNCSQQKSKYKCPINVQYIETSFFPLFTQPYQFGASSLGPADHNHVSIVIVHVCVL